MDKKEIVMPDFDQWAFNMAKAAGEALTNHHTSQQSYTNAYLKIYSEALQQAFEQGLYYGKRLGFEEGVETGWSTLLDRDLQKRNNTRSGD